VRRITIKLKHVTLSIGGLEHLVYKDGENSTNNAYKNSTNYNKRWPWCISLLFDCLHNVTQNLKYITYIDGW